MLRKLLFSAFAALVLAGGLLVASAVPGDTAPVPMMSAVPHVQADDNLIQVRTCGPWNNWCQPVQNCGPWNNWCRPVQNCGSWNNWCGRGPGGGGGASGCVSFGGVQFCIGNGGSNCRWHNGRKYCNNGPAFVQKCVTVNNKRYCNYKHNGPCVNVNGERYCRFN